MLLIKYWYRIKVVVLPYWIIINVLRYVRHKSTYGINTSVTITTTVLKKCVDERF